MSEREDFCNGSDAGRPETPVDKIRIVMEPIWLYYQKYQQQMAKPYIPTSIQNCEQERHDNYEPQGVVARQATDCEQGEGRSRAQKMRDAFPYLSIAQAGFLGLIMDVIDVTMEDDGWLIDLLNNLTIDGIPFRDHPRFQPPPGFQEELLERLLKMMEQ